MYKLLLPLTLAGLLAGGAHAADALRPFGVADSIQMSSFLNPSGKDYLPRSRILPSPDGRRFLVATMRGDLVTGQRIVTLWVLEADQIEAFSRSSAHDFRGARAIATWGSSSNETPITEWTWTSDSSAVLFRGADDEGLHRLYSVPLAGGAPKALTPQGKDVTQFDERSGVIAYLAHDGTPASEQTRTAGPGIADIVPGRDGGGLITLLQPKLMEQFLKSSESELWVIRDGATTQVKTEAGEAVTIRETPLVVSSDGQSVIAAPFARRIPKAWEQYKAPPGWETYAFVADPENSAPRPDYFRARQYTSINLRTGRTTLIVDAPVETRALNNASHASTGPEGQIALVGAYSPLAGRAPDDEAGLQPCALTVVPSLGSAPTCVERNILKPNGPGFSNRPQIVTLRWSADGHALAAGWATPNTPEAIVETRYAERNGRWTRVADTPRASEELKVTVLEAYDHPPVLVAVRKGAAPRTLLEPNPALATLRMGAIKPYSWPTPAGPVWEGALVLPADFKPSHRYPLIIQTHGLDKSRFLVDGPSASGFAAQALASRGFIVLQVQEGPNSTGTPEENTVGADSYIAAAKKLADEGLIDPTKVGITSWSHYGPHTMNALLKAPKMFAAAVFAESSYASYPVYLNNIEYMGGTSRERSYRSQIGPPPFGDGLQVWLQRAEGFRLGGLCTPALLHAYSSTALVYGWPSYAALAAQHKPVDLLYIRSGDHVLVKPLERLAAQQQVVDWYDYWINGVRSEDSAKAKQYAVWDQLRAGPRCGDNGDPK
jgi:hypothetical protein